MDLDEPDTKIAEQCDICHKSFTDLITHVRTHFYDKPFLCKSCNNSFKTRSELSLHQRECVPPKLYPCTVCKITGCKLPHHAKGSKKTSKKTFVCQVCKKIFLFFSQWSVHTSMCHTETKRFRCRDCGKCYGFPSTLKIHESYCSNRVENGFRCEDCNRNFKQRVDFVTHMVSRHSMKSKSTPTPISATISTTTSTSIATSTSP